MTGSAGGDARTLESALLFLSREPDRLAALLRHLLPAADLDELVRSGGRRRAGVLDPAAELAGGVGRNPRLLRSTARALAGSPLAGDALAPPEEDLREELLPAFSDAALRAALARDLLGGTEEEWERAGARALDWNGRLPAPALSPHAAPTAPAARARPDRSRERLAALRRERDGCKARLAEQQRELARLQDELGRQRQRAAQVQEERDELRDELREARRRRSRMKKKLADTQAASAREQSLQEERDELLHRLHILEQKLLILEEERDDLHAVLQDHDRFQEIPEEEIPSFQSRPLIAEEQGLAERLAALRETGRPPFRILVVGGGEPQLRHQDKLAEYAEVLGFRSEWRMAEYTAWHKAMRSLQADMEERFDALVILHWNRTTFTRKAREICNRAGQKPCLTCHYEGFTSLRRTLQETLRQLLDAPGG